MRIIRLAQKDVAGCKWRSGFVAHDRLPRGPTPAQPFPASVDPTSHCVSILSLFLIES